MLVRLLVKMLCILVLCPALLVAVQTLTIDSQLGTSVEDCFERISIGEQLPPDAIYRNVSELTTRECEQICKQDKQCQTYDYGVGAKGNATCNLSMLNEKELKEKNLLRRHPDYDVYIRRFQCEQSPPSPLQSPQFDDPGDGPAHRPVFRPDEDEPKRPERPLDEYPTDSRPFESRPDLLKPIPPYRPYNNHIDERPDDYLSQKPAYDSPPSYGAHKPQDIPYKPNPIFDRPPNYGAHRPQDIPYKPHPDFDRPPSYGSHKPQEISYKPTPDFDRPPSYGAHKPQDIPYKPNKPHQNESLYKPDPYDVLQFQGPYRPTRPLDPGFWRPDPYNPPHLNDDIPDLYGPKPIRPSRPNDIPGPDPYGLEKPQYHYIIRPNRRPRPELDSGYGIKPLKPDYPTKPDPYGQEDLGHPSGPLGPPESYRPPYDYPSRPYEKPSYNYNSQYASNYGQSQDNSIYLEIYDPPRPYRPLKRPVNDRPSYGAGQSGYGQNYGYGDQGSYGYGSHASQNSYSQSHSQSYGQGTITELDHFDQNYHRPQDSGYRPQKPAYGSQNSGYGTSSSDTSQGYGSQTQKPSDVTQKPSYGSDQGYVSGSQYGNDHSDVSYGSQSSQPYGSSTRPSYGNQDDNQSGYGLQKPQKPNDSNQRPSYGSQGYGTSQPSYGSGPPADDGHQGSYGGSHGSYGIQQSHSYSEHQDSHYSSHQSSQSSGYGISRPPYSDRPSYSDNRPAYGGNRPYDDDKPSYGNDRPSYGNDKPSYGNDKPSYGNDKPSYVNDKPSYSDNRPSYGNDRPSYGNDRPSYENNRPSYGDDRPPYGNDKPSYMNDKPSYGNDRPSYGNDRPSYSNDRPSYGNDRPSYGNDKPSYGNDRPFYGNDRPSYGEKPSYDSNRPAYGDTSKPVFDNHRPGYGETSKPSYDNNRPSYGDSKPSYENNPPSYGNDRPSFDNNRPDPSYGNNRPSYGSNQDSSQSGYGSQGSESYDYKNSGSAKPGNQDKNKKPGSKPVETRPNQTALDRPNIKPVYEYELEKPSNVPSYIVKPGGEVITSRPVTVGDYGEKPGQRREPGYPGIPLSYKACFRRVLAGRRALRSFVRKVVACERLEDCRRECADERRFHCESFNYRLDPSFRGKGLCELMTKPIEAFDISRDFVEDKDYDFYEVDRNSLEPHCPESLGGPGLLHSGFLSSKPNRLPNYQNQWDRTDWQDGYHRDYDRFYEEKRGYTGGRRRYQDQFYIPYQIGVGRSSEADIENWGTYGGVYGGYDNYYKDRNDYYNSVNHWRIPNNSRTYGVKPGYNSDFDYYSLGKEKSWESQRYGSWKRGRWNSSGANGLDYGESNYYKPHKPHHYAENRDDDGGGKDCSSRRRPGMSLGSGAIRRSLLARNVVECEAACFDEREFKCVSYSYRYSSSRGSDNCFLSERPYRGLELSADSGSDVYAMPQDQGCSTISHKPWIESECFWHVRSEAAVSGSAVRSALTVTGLGACEAECIRAHAFFCRGFSFRFDSPTIGDDLPNCILTSSPPTSLTGGSVRRSHGHELYARGNYGRGCEPALYDDARHSHQEDGECYLQYDNAAKLIGAAVRGQARVRDEQACGTACTEAPFRCLSFSFNNHAPAGVDNCLLSEIRLFDLQRGVDYQHSVDDWLFAFDLFNGQCWRKVHGKHPYEEPSSELPRPLIPGESGPSGSGYPSAPSEPYLPASGPPSGPGYKPGYPVSSPSGPDYKPGYPATSPSGPDYKPGYPASSPSGPSYKPSYPSSPEYHEPSAPEPSGHGYKPGYAPSEPSAPGYLPKPGFQPPFRPSEPSGPSYSKPDYRPDPSGPSYSKPNYRPDTSGPSYLPGPKPGYGSEPSGPSYLPRPKPEYRPDPIGHGYSPGFKPGYRPPELHGYPDSGFKPGYPPPRPEPGYRPGEGRPRPYPERPSAPSRPLPSHGGHREEQEPMSVSWRHYTVSGFPCRAGTTCAQNKVAGHWACEPEGGEIGSWDYCCAPTHRCGYSEGFPKPWCYVGTMEDQWRPCSEKYYPYHQHNIPHPSQGGHRDDQRRPPRPHQDGPNRFQDGDRPHLSPYATEAERKYWDDLYKNGPQAYYDKYGNPLPGYTKVPTASRPYIKYRHNYQGQGSGTWVPVAGQDAAHASGGLGAPRYWPVAYLHKGPPPNMTYFFYNETQTTTTTEAYPRTPIAPPRENPPQDFNRATEKPKDRDVVEARSHRDEKTRNITDRDIFQVDLNQFTTTTTTSTTTTSKPEVKQADSLVEEKEMQQNKSEVEMIQPENVKEEKESENIKGIDDKLEDFTSPIEVLDIEDAAKGEKISDLKTLEAEERQIEAIGRLLASRRGSKLVLEKRSQKDLETKSIAVDKDLVDFNFGNRFPTTERRGIIQKVTKDEIERERNADKSLEVSETTFVRPPRVLSTTENIRKAIVNGKVFYDATIREQRDIFLNATRKAKGLRHLEDARGPSVIMNSNFGKKKVIKARNVNPVRRVRRVYRKRYNPEEVRRRLIERERSMKMENDTSRKL